MKRRAIEMVELRDGHGRPVGHFINGELAYKEDWLLLAGCGNACMMAFPEDETPKRNKMLKYPLPLKPEGGGNMIVEHRRGKTEIQAMRSGEVWEGRLVENGASALFIVTNTRSLVCLSTGHLYNENELYGARHWPNAKVIV